MEKTRRINALLCNLALTWALSLGALSISDSAHADVSPFRKRPMLRIDRVDAGKPPYLRIYLTDLDSTNAPITDRKRQLYRLLVDGLPQSAAIRGQPASKVRDPLALTLVIQVSPALKDVLSDAVDASKRLITALPPASRIGLVAYTDVVTQDLKPTTAQSAIGATDDLRIHHDSVEVQLLDAIRDALEGLKQAQLPAQRMMVDLSDGLTADLSFRAFAALGRRAREKGVRIHTIGYAPVEPARLRTLLELSRRGGGTFRYAKRGPGVRRAFAGLLDELQGQQVLTYETPEFFYG